MPLSQYLDDLYPLARVLVGEAHADALVAESYRRAAETPPDERPSDVQTWLVRLVLDTRAEMEAASESTEAPDTSGLDDEFRRDVARHTAERVVPVAFAACSVQERLVLTLDVLGEASDEAVAAVLDADVDAARRARSEAHASLRASLRDSLTGPERMLVDVALPDAVLDDTLHRFLSGRLRPAPAALRTEVAAVLRDAAPSTDSDDASLPSDSSAPAPSDADGPPWWDASGWSTTLQRVVVSLLILILVGGGAYALSFVLAPTPEPTPSLITFTAQRADAVRPALATSDPNEAAAYMSTELSRSVQVPKIDATRLTGVGRLDIAPGIDLPVLLYADSTDDARISTFVYSYALLDRLDDRAPLDVSVRRRLSDEQTIVVRRTGDRTVLLWRRRDAVYVAVAPTTTATSLSERIR